MLTATAPIRQRMSPATAHQLLQNSGGCFSGEC
uniref:Uncharacterized protein n=1 Tax=Arundo donax TaxID=35708 RepID=A0A0A9GAI0_ARUDO